MVSTGRSPVGDLHQATGVQLAEEGTDLSLADLSLNLELADQKVDQRGNRDRPFHQRPDAAPDLVHVVVLPAGNAEDDDLPVEIGRELTGLAHDSGVRRQVK